MDSLQAEQAAREKAAFWDGVRISAPTMPGLVAWGAVTGMVLVQSGLSLWQAIVMTLMVYAGSAQLAVLPLIVAGAPVWLIFLTALLVNFRFIIFSAVVGPPFFPFALDSPTLVRLLQCGFGDGFLPAAFSSTHSD